MNILLTILLIIVIVFFIIIAIGLLLQSDNYFDKKLLKAGFKGKYFHTGDIIMHYVVGPNNGPPIVFIPGQSVTWEEYTQLMPLLKDKFQVYAVSVRGHGNSSWTPGQYSFNQIGQDMITFLEKVVGRPAIVAGNSFGGVQTAWLAANAPNLVKAIVLEDPPLFRCEYPAIKKTAVYESWIAFSRMAIAGGGGYTRFLQTVSVNTTDADNEVIAVNLPPKLILKLITLYVAAKQALAPGSAINLPFLPFPARILFKGNSQFDGNFALAFVNGSFGEGFDHAQCLTKVTQPILFLHSNWFMQGDVLVGALDDDDVARVESLIKGSWKYVKMKCGHMIAMEAPVDEAKEIINWANEINL